MTVNTPLHKDPMASSIASGLSSKLKFPVIGIGASAGGTEALLSFFEEMPADNGMAFVIVLHLAPEQTSHLAGILQNVTSMPVQQVTATTAIEKNHVYVIAPASDLQMVDDYLQVRRSAVRPGPQVAIDLFFRTLAESHRELAVSIILSGVGSDGSVGLAHVKEMGGVTLAQSPDDAKFDGMPNSAIATGKVDIVLPAAEMPQRLIELRDNARLIRLPTESEQEHENLSSDPSFVAQQDGEKALQEIMVMLRTRTSHDFRRYKRATVLRRLERRLQVNGIRDLGAYREFLQLHPEETRLLLDDMLISVTHFFRDKEAFEALQREVMPALFANREEEGERVRVWAPGVATGEEAYSLAMLLEEASAASHVVPPFQLFATDIDEKAITAARAGVYPETIVSDVSAERLRQFFTKDQSHFRVKKKLREHVLFALHNVLSDPPFSKLDLVCCRNLMIYLDREAQAEVLRTFHFALRPGGYLFLGSSESAEIASRFFSVVDKKHRIYRASTAARISGASPTIASVMPGLRPIVNTVEPAGKRKSSYGELHQRLLEQFAPPSVLINRNSEIVHLSDRAGRFLHYAGGEPSHNVISVVHPTLGLELRTAIFQALQGNTSVESRRVRLVRDNRPYFVKMTVRPAHDPDAADDFLLVLFDEVEDPMDAESSAQNEGSRDPLVAQLERELQRTRDQLQVTIEQSETSTEELTASNEELKAINKELRSATEEFETSKEELQSINEELITVNAELKSKVDETAKINDDLQNLITANDIGTIFVDRAMRIKRFTPRAADVFSIIPSDVGRPLFDITHRLEYDELAADTAEAFGSLRLIEREVRSTHGHWYIARFMPYRTTEDRIDGAVLTFIDITARREAEERLHEGERRMRVVAESTREYAIITLDENGLVMTWNTGASRMFGFEEGEIVGRPFGLLYPREERENGVPEEEMRRAREEGRLEEDRWHVRNDGSRVYCSGVLMRLDDNSLRGFAKIAREVKVDEAERKRDEFLSAVSHKLKSPLNLIYANAELLARSPEAHRSLQVSRAADTIRRSAISQARLIDDLLDMSRLLAGELTILCTAVDWREIVERICAALDEEARGKGIKLSPILPENPVIIQADLPRMEQVVWNLVANALQSPGAGRVSVTLAEDGEAATLQLEDDGSGIEAELLPHVFDIVEQGRPSLGRDDRLGIGLYLVRELVGLHGGSIKVESAGMASGARFTVTLPLHPDNARGTVSGRYEAMPLKGVHILMVDEDASTNDAFQALLSTEGAQVTCTGSSEEAIQVVDNQVIDIVLSGLNLSGPERLAFLAALRAEPENAHLPVIALSGVVQRGGVQGAMQNGYSAYLTKPIVLDELVATIARVRASKDE